MSRSRELIRWLAQAPDEVRARVWRELSPADVRAFGWDWTTHAQRNQEPLPGDLRVWLLLAGRGFGKTRTGAEWILRVARDQPGARITLVGATVEDVDRIMVGGESEISPALRRTRNLPSSDRAGCCGFARGRRRRLSRGRMAPGCAGRSIISPGRMSWASGATRTRPGTI